MTTKLEKAAWLFIQGLMVASTLGIGIKISIWVIQDYLPTFCYFDGFSLIVVAAIISAQIILQLLTVWEEANK